MNNKENIKIWKDKEASQYYSKKLKKVIQVTKHGQHYYIKQKGRGRRIDPEKYELKSLEEASKLGWLLEKEEDYGFDKIMNSVRWKALVAASAIKINTKYQDRSDKYYQEQKLRDLYALEEQAKTVYAKRYIPTRYIEREITIITKNLPIHPKWGKMPSSLYHLAETVKKEKLPGRREWRNWCEKNNEILREVFHRDDRLEKGYTNPDTETRYLDKGSFKSYNFWCQVQELLSKTGGKI